MNESVAVARVSYARLSQKELSKGKATYLGLDKNRLRFVFKKDGEKLRGFGTLSRTKPSEYPTRFNRVSIKGFERDPKKDVRLLSIHEKSGVEYLFTGQIFAPKRVKPPKSDFVEPKVDTVIVLKSKLVASKAPCSVQGVSASNRRSEGKSNEPKQKRTSATRNETYLQRLQIVVAQKAAGDDPPVRMAFLAPYVGESKANLYRKIKTGEFPVPTKRGTSSFWLLSVVEAYKAGNWAPGWVALLPALSPPST